MVFKSAPRSFILLLLAASLAGCGRVGGGGGGASGGVEPYVRAGESLRADSGKWLFKGLLRGLNSREHFVLAAEFLAPTATVALHSHFNGFVWRDGAVVTFERRDGRLFLSLGVPGFQPRRSELPEGFVGADGRFKARIEVHNGLASGVRVLVWRYNESLQGEVERPRPFIGAANADFDSRAAGWIFPAHGRGAHWGVEFDDARIVNAYRDAPYVP
jgi:hypothetical protein